MKNLPVYIIGSVRFIDELNVKKLIGRRRVIRVCPLKGIVRFSEVSVKGSLTVPGVPSLMTSTKMTLKLNYIYMKAL
jgi:hypothetical protein